MADFKRETVGLILREWRGDLRFDINTFGREAVLVYSITGEQWEKTQ